MDKELYVCCHEDNNDQIDRYDLLDPGSNNWLVSFPVSRSVSGTPLIPASMLHKLAELQNQGYKIRFFF